MLFYFTYAIRVLRRDPGFTVPAILILAIGIGANTAMFSIFQAVLLRPLGVDDPARIVMMWPAQPSQPVGEISFTDYEEWRRHSRSFDQLAIAGSTTWWGTIAAGGREPVGPSY